MFTLMDLMVAMGVQDLLQASKAIAANQDRKRAFQKLACVVGTSGIKQAIDYEMHHPIPFSMGGPDKNLIPLPRDTHRLFHFTLNLLIRSKGEGFSNYTSADKWSEKLVGTTEKKALLVLIKQAARYVDKQCGLPKGFRIIDYIKKNEKEWLKS